MPDKGRVGTWKKRIEKFLFHLANDGDMAEATWNQGMNGFFLYKKLLKVPLDGEINTVQAKKKRNVPVPYLFLIF